MVACRAATPARLPTSHEAPSAARTQPAPATTSPAPVTSVTDPKPANEVAFVQAVEATPAFRYARLGVVECESELTRRAIAVIKVDAARGVLIPVRLAGGLRGVVFHGEVPERARATSPYEIMDCRLVLALDDFATILGRHGIVRAVPISAYRPPARGWAQGRVGKQHSGALALDIASFVRADGSSLVIERDFHGRIGAKTCGLGPAQEASTPEASELRSIVCEAAEAHLFQVTLTPNFNLPHHNHFHFEVTPDVRWFLVH